MKFLSVCSGIEAASVAWNPLGWKAAAFSEIEKFPSAVLAHHYPGVPNLGDMTRFQEWPDLGPVDLLCGGTPCQSFSVAGLRKGLADPRGNLMLTFGAIAAKHRPRWLVWENVPGVLSSNEGRDFGAFLGLLGVLGYGFAYRVLDAQYFGLAQRRKRVFVVGCLGDWRSAAAVLFERHSLSGHPAPSRQARQDVAAGAGDGTAFCVRPPSHGAAWKGDGADNFVTHALTGEGFDASEDGTGRGTPLVPMAVRTANTSANGHGVACDVTHTLDGANGQCIAFDTTKMTSKANRSQPKAGDPCHPLAAGAHAPAIAFDARQSDVIQYGDMSGPLDTDGHTIGVLHASAYEADAASVLRTLRDRLGAEAVAEWGSRILDSLQSPQVLRAWLHAEGIRRSAGDFRSVVDNCPLPREEGVAAGAMREVWETGPDGRTPQGRGLAKQLAYELGEALSELPCIGAFKPETVQRLRGAAEGARLLRKTLSEVQAVGRSARREGEPAPTSMQVRRLTPRECEALMGFPPDYTLIPYRGKPAADGPRYKALGNSWAVPVVRWIGRRIEAVSAVTAERLAA